MIFCTSICANYIPKAKLLAKSIKKYNSGAIVVVCLTEKKVPEFVKDNFIFWWGNSWKDLGIDNFDKFIFKHSIVEASTAVKGHLFKYLLENILITARWFT